MIKYNTAIGNTCILAIAGFLASCATSPMGWPEPSHERYIAHEFINKLIKNDEYNLGTTTVQIRRGQNNFGNELRSKLSQEGYYIQTIPSHFVAPNLLSYQGSYNKNEKGKTIIYTVRIGRIEASRTFSKSISGWKPLGNFTMRSTASNLEIPLVDMLVADEDKISTSQSQGQRIAINTRQPINIQDESVNIATVDKAAGIEPSGKPVESSQPAKNDFANSITTMLDRIDEPDTNDIYVNNDVVKITSNDQSTFQEIEYSYIDSNPVKLQVLPVEPAHVLQLANTDESTSSDSEWVAIVTRTPTASTNIDIESVETTSAIERTSSDISTDIVINLADMYKNGETTSSDIVDTQNEGMESSESSEYMPVINLFDLNENGNSTTEAAVVDTASEQPSIEIKSDQTAFNALINTGDLNRNGDNL